MHWKKICLSSVEIENVLESSENEIGGILELAKSIGSESFVWLKIYQWKKKFKIYYYMLEKKIDEADLMEMELEDVNQINSIIAIR